MIKIYCEDYDFNSLGEAFEGEVISDCPLSAEIIICDEETIKTLNREQRKVDAVTDVLSFPSLDGIRGKELKKADYPADPDEEGGIFLGSIAICEKRAEEQAAEYGHSLRREINYLAAHGLCHLLGYDHMTEEDKKQMREKEERVLGKINAGRD